MVLCKSRALTRTCEIPQASYRLQRMLSAAIETSGEEYHRCQVHLVTCHQQTVLLAVHIAGTFVRWSTCVARTIA